MADLKCRTSEVATGNMGTAESTKGIFTNFKARDIDRNMGACHYIKEPIKNSAQG